MINSDNVIDVGSFRALDMACEACPTTDDGFQQLVNDGFLMSESYCQSCNN
eukprot:Pgem_evm1s18221